MPQLSGPCRNRSPAHELACSCLDAGISAAHPGSVVGDRLSFDDGRLRIDDETYDLDGYDELRVVGTGNAAGRAAAALETLLGDAIDGGVVATDDPVSTERIELVTAEHPVPGSGSRAAGRRVRSVAERADERTLLLVIVGGGGSALLADPAPGIALDDLRSVTDALLSAGAPIDDVNAVRKHCSAIKGGQLANAATPANVVGLVFSDVVGDDLGTIASGPIAPDPTTFADALDALDRHGIDPPAAIRERIDDGADGRLSETPDPDHPAFDRVTNHVVATARMTLDAARERATEAGYEPLVLSSRMRGDAAEIGRAHAAIAEEIRETGQPVEPPAVLLSAGEVTVTVTGDGTGGPNGTLALAAALELDASDVVLASVDTDGIDGPTDAAGAIVDDRTVEEPADARAALADDDSATYLDERDALLRSGPTGTNVNDLRAIVVPEE